MRRVCDTDWSLASGDSKIPTRAPRASAVGQYETLVTPAHLSGKPTFSAAILFRAWHSRTWNELHRGERLGGCPRDRRSRFIETQRD